MLLKIVNKENAWLQRMHYVLNQILSDNCETIEAPHDIEIPISKHMQSIQSLLLSTYMSPIYKMSLPII